MLIYFYYFIIATLPVFYQKQKKKFIYLLFVLNVVGIVFRNYYDQGVYIFTLRSAVFFAFLLLVVRLKHWKKHRLLTFYLIYLVLLIPLSDYFIPSLFGAIDTIIIWGTFVLAYEFFNKTNSLRPLIGVVIMTNSLFLLYILFLNIGIIEMHNTQMDLGYGMLKTGVFSTAQLNVIVVTVSITPFLLYLKPGFIHRGLLINTSFISAAIILLNLKRTSIIAMLICLGAYFLFTQKIKGVFYIAFLGSIMLFLVLFVFKDVFQDQIASRQYIFDIDHYITGESRTAEPAVVYKELKDRSVFHVLFGKNLYVTSDIWLKYFGYERIMHNDWTSLIVTTGVFGFFVFLLLFVKTLLNVIKTKPQANVLIKHRSLSIGLLGGCIIWILFGGFFNFVHSSTLVLFVVGSYLGQIKNQPSN